MASSSRHPRLKLKEIEVECGRPASMGTRMESINLMLTVVRGPRGRRKLMGEAFARQVYQPIIHFKVYDDGDLESLFTRFLNQLVHRGYRPVQYRELDLEDRWSSWLECNLSEVDLSDLEDAAEADMGVAES